MGRKQLGLYLHILVDTQVRRIEVEHINIVQRGERLETVQPVPDCVADKTSANRSIEKIELPHNLKCLEMPCTQSHRIGNNAAVFRFVCH